MMILPVGALRHAPRFRWPILLVVVWLSAGLLGQGFANQLAPEVPESRILIGIHDAEFAVSGSRPGTTDEASLNAEGQPVSARETVGALARQYQLDIVEEWPMPLLSLYCSVMQAPPGQGRRILSELSRDPRVQLAQPVQHFRTETGGHGGGHAIDQPSNSIGAHG